MLNHNRSHKELCCGVRHSWEAFALTDLLVVIAVVAVLTGLFLPAVSKTRVKSQAALDVNNVQQILLATHLYEANNSDYMPHPTWGGVDGTANGGPDGWAFAVKNNGQLPGLPNYIPSAAGKDYNSSNYKNQLEFFKIGQLGPYLNNNQVLHCPLDVAQRSAGVYRKWWHARQVKITSYCMNGTVGGYVPTDARLNGQTYKTFQFKPKDIIFWEQNEAIGGYFNDAANNPLMEGENVSQRHARVGQIKGSPSVNGGAIVGRINGSVDVLKMKAFNDLASHKTNPQQKQNELLNGPGFRP